MLYGSVLLRVLSLVLLLFFATALEAQLNRGVIEGIVTDPQGAVVPGVEVTLTSVDTNVSTQTKTNSSGYYRAVDLVPGRFIAHFEVSGFQRLEVKDIEVLAGVTHQVNAHLTLGEITQTVEVSSTAPLLETAASNFSTSLETSVVQDLPLAGREIQNLVFLLPGVTQVGGPPGSSFGFNSQYGTLPDPLHVFGSFVSVSGGQAGANAWYLDGNLNLSTIAENVVVNPSPDAVSEFQSVSNSFAAEYSRTGGAVFNVTLKSGTNNFHGNVYEFHRNDATNARNPFTSIGNQGQRIKERQLRYNNFGGTLGGPIVKDKTHFFASWDVSTLHLLGQKTFTVPTLKQRLGDLSEDPDVVNFGLWDPFSTQGPDANGLFSRQRILNPDGTPATAIPQNMLDPIAMFFMNSFPAPNFNDNPNTGCPKVEGNLLCDNFLGSIGNSQNTHNVCSSIPLTTVFTDTPGQELPIPLWTQAGRRTIPMTCAIRSSLWATRILLAPL